MSTFKSILFGTLAAWIRVGTGIATQLAFTTIALSWWSVEDFGLWLALMIVPTLFTIPDNALHTYMEGEFLKLGKSDPQKLNQLLWDASVPALAIGFVELLAVIALVYFGVFAQICGIESTDPRAITCNLFAIGNAIIWLVFGAIPGLYSKLLVAIGYFTRITWWSTASILALSLTPILVVLGGGDFSSVAIAYVIVRTLYAIGFLLDCVYLGRKEGIRFVRPMLVNSMKYWLKSLILVVEGLSEQLRQQGIRFLLAPFSGSVGVASFATTRSAANLALQSLNVVGGPVVPQIMRYIRDRDQIRLEGMIGWFHLFVLVIFLPGIVSLQILLPYIFPIWTRGKIEFDPILCGTLLTSLIVFACAQPAIVIVRSNNLLISQLLLSVVVTVCTVASFFAMASKMGVSAAAFSILIADIVASISYVWVASKWLPKHSLQWPWATFKWVLVGSASAVGVLLTLMVHREYSQLIAFPLVGVWFVSIYSFSNSLPAFVQLKMKTYNPLNVLPSLLGQ